MLKINYKYLQKLFLNTLLIILFPILFILSFLYSSNYNLLNHKNTIINGNGFYSKNYIESTLDLSKSIFDIKPYVLQNQLNKMDFVESSKVSKVFPNTILIEIIENKPLLYLKNNENLIIIDEKQNLLPVNNKVKSYYDVPVLIINNKLAIEINDLINTDLDLYKEIITVLKFSKKKFLNIYSEIDNINIHLDSYELLYNKKTKIFLSKNMALDQINNLYIFQETIKNHRLLKDYIYINMKIPNQIIVKEKNQI